MLDKSRAPSFQLPASWSFVEGYLLPVTAVTAPAMLQKTANFGQPNVATAGRLATSRGHVAARARHRTRSKRGRRNPSSYVLTRWLIMTLMKTLLTLSSSCHSPVSHLSK